MSRISLLGLVALIATSSAGIAESVQLRNGDVIQGQVVSLDGQNLVMKSDVLGELTIERSRVKNIHLGTIPAPFPTPMGRVAEPQSVDQQEGNENTEPSAELSLPSLKPDNDSQLPNQLPKLLPLLENPDVQKHFQRNLQGILSGELNLEDIRKQARDARDLMRGYEEELGPNAEIVEGYLDILDRFINEPGLSGLAQPESESPSDGADSYSMPD